ncbi:MAG: hypothetical protein LBR17_01315 [Bacteroidales bacterium]|jgi:hypothetical protein|nr:hypothetical protein [Bacteroidales bacterium]
MRKQIYLSIKNAIKEIQDSDGQPIFKHFDLWNNSIAFMEKETPMALPAIFIEFLPVTWQTLGLNLQQATMQFRVHIITRWYSQTHDSSPDEDSQLDYLDYPDILFKNLQGKSVMNGIMFDRLTSQTDHNHATLVNTIETYSAQIRDKQAINKPNNAFVTIQ